LPDSEGYGARPPRLKPPSLLASNLKDLLGFQWVDDTGDEALLVGTWSVLAGGADGFVTAHAASSPDPASSLVWAAVAEAAASEAVAQAIAGDVRWFDLATPATPPHLDEAGAQLDQWWRRLTGAPPSAADRAVWEGLLRDVGATDGVAAGWTAVLSAMLRDPDFLTY
jgi:hypothetical protein